MPPTASASSLARSEGVRGRAIGGGREAGDTRVETQQDERIRGGSQGASVGESDATGVGKKPGEQTQENEGQRGRTVTASRVVRAHTQLHEVTRGHDSQAQ